MGVAALAAFFFLRGPGDEERRVAGTQLTPAELSDAYSELCDVSAQAGSDVDAARDLFYGRVHSPLHEIARVAGEVDRSVAARLLEAKNDVERAFADDAPAPEVSAALGRLLPRTGQALRSVGVTTSDCDPSPTP